MFHLVSRAIPAPTPSPTSLRGARVALTGLSAVFLLEMLDNSVLNVALPTIGRELHASTTSLQWVTSAYTVVFGGLMLVLGAVADRFGRRRTMLIGLAVLAAASLATLLATTVGQLIAVRAAMGAAAAMTTPGSMALSFRLFREASLRLRAITLISTVGLVGMAVGPTAGGLVLAVAPWQVLLLGNVPIAVLALVGIRLGIAADQPSDLHRDPIDLPGAALGTAAVVLALVAPTLFVDEGAGSWRPWAVSAAALLALVLLVLRERSARHPLLDLGLVGHPLVSSGLAFKAAAGMATAGLGYLVTLQLQLDWGWPPALAAIGMLPQVVVLVAGSALVNPFVDRVGMTRAGWLSTLCVVLGLALYGLAGRHGYPWVALALVLEAAGMRVVGVVAGTTVLNGLPADRTTVGAALLVTVAEVASGIGTAVAGTVLAALFAGAISAPSWSLEQHRQFRTAVTTGSLVLTALAAALIGWGTARARRRGPSAEQRQRQVPGSAQLIGGGPSRQPAGQRGVRPSDGGGVAAAADPVGEPGVGHDPHRGGARPVPQPEAHPCQQPAGRLGGDVLQGEPDVEVEMVQQHLGESCGGQLIGVDHHVGGQGHRRGRRNPLQQVEGLVEPPRTGVQVDLQGQAVALGSPLDLLVALAHRGVQRHLPSLHQLLHQMGEGVGVAGQMGGDMGSGPAGQPAGGLPLVVGDPHRAAEQPLGGLELGGADLVDTGADLQRTGPRRFGAHGSNLVLIGGCGPRGGAITRVPGPPPPGSPRAEGAKNCRSAHLR